MLAPSVCAHSSAHSRLAAWLVAQRHTTLACCVRSTTPGLLHCFTAPPNSPQNSPPVLSSSSVALLARCASSSLRRAAAACLLLLEPLLGQEALDLVAQLREAHVLRHLSSRARASARRSEEEATARGGRTGRRRRREEEAGGERWKEHTRVKRV